MPDVVGGFEGVWEFTTCRESILVVLVALAVIVRHHELVGKCGGKQNGSGRFLVAVSAKYPCRVA